jgi:hypothetical protein
MKIAKIIRRGLEFSRDDYEGYCDSRYPQDGGSGFLRNIGTHVYSITSLNLHPKRKLATKSTQNGTQAYKVEYKPLGRRDPGRPS